MGKEGSRAHAGVSDEHSCSPEPTVLESAKKRPSRPSLIYAFAISLLLCPLRNRQMELEKSISRPLMEKQQARRWYSVFKADGS